MKKRQYKKYLVGILIFFLSLFFVWLLWLTLFSRFGRFSRYFYLPFRSYIAVFHGNRRALLEDIGNIVIFIPIGITVSLLLGKRMRSAFAIGFLLSLIIEGCQWFFWLGSLEFDDLIHNSLGAGIGSVLVNRTDWGKSIRRQVVNRRAFVAFLILTGVILGLLFGYQGLRWLEMKRISEMNNREDGAVNLMVLSPDPVYIGETSVGVTYQKDGSILIEGDSDKRAWVDLGKIKLEAGQYSFSGLSGMKKETIALVLCSFNPEENRFVRITEEIGYDSTNIFELKEKSVIQLLISIYPGKGYRVEARPAIYHELSN